MQKINTPRNIRIGVSTCLTGEPVRYDAGHKWDPFVSEELGRYLDLVPICPEVELGLGAPREPMHLVGDLERPRLVTRDSAMDHTEAMVNWARTRAEALEPEGLCGFVFKSKSPSCGLRVTVYDQRGRPGTAGVGLFARAFMARFPLLPVEEEGRLHDPVLRENFIERVFVCQRWQELRGSGPRAEDLIAFHRRHKLLLMSHSPRLVTQLGRCVAQADGKSLPVQLSRYERTLQEALRLQATAAKHVNVLHHAMGYFKTQLGVGEKQELLESIARYREEQLPLLVPITLINHYARHYGVTYLREQWYLNPHPWELKLRNHP